MARPDGRIDRRHRSPLERRERLVHPWVSYVVLPLFALCNAGVAISLERLREALLSPLGLGILLGLVAGKFLGILIFSWVAVRLRIARLPSHVRWSQLAGIGVLGGIGFTVALFINELAFQDENLVGAAKMAILTASFVSAVAGYAILRLSLHRGAID